MFYMFFKDPYDKGLARAWHCQELVELSGDWWNFQEMEPRERSLGSSGHLWFAPDGDGGTPPFLPLSLPIHEMNNFIPVALQS